MSTVPDVTRHWPRALAASAGFVAVLWVSELADLVTSGSLDRYGIRPRSEDGLWGVVVSPLLHSGFGHLEANSGPLLVLGFLVATVSVGRYLAVLAVVWLVSGLGVWLTAPSLSITVGASGLVFGLLTYLLVAGFLERSAARILVGVVVFLVWGGVLLGVLPGQPGISWQAHLFGAVGGVLAALLLVDRRGEGTPRRLPSRAG